MVMNNPTLQDLQNESDALYQKHLTDGTIWSTTEIKLADINLAISLIRDTL